MRVKNNKNVSRVPVGLSLQLRHLHQYAGRTCWEIAKMKSYKKFFKVAICKHTNENTTNLVVHKRQQNQGKLYKLSVRRKRNMIRQTKLF